MLCIALLFSGCGGFHLASSIDDLISPVAPAGADASVQSAMDAYCKGGYSVKIPAAGKYTTSYIFYDFDDDGQKEALAFYEPNDALGKIDMAVLEQSGENWQVIANIQGEGTDVYSVDFCDVNGDGKTEFLISWNMISYSTSHLMSVYKMTGSGQESKLTALAEPMQYSAYIPADLNNDGVQEVLFFGSNEVPFRQRGAVFLQRRQADLVRRDPRGRACERLPQVTGGQGRRQAGGVCGRGKIRWGVYAHRADLLERLL